MQSILTKSYRQAASASLFSPAAGYLVIAALMLAYAASYAWSAPNTDSADELMRAYEIRHGLAYPLEGPPLGGVIHLGPAWFYLTAIPLWISESWLAVALFIGLVSGLKFPLAYYCGRQLVDEDFGVLWASAMFVPGWNTLENLVFLNPNAVSAAVLGVLALSLRGLRKPMGVVGLGMLGLAYGLAVHVHPTSIPVFVLGIAVLWVYRRQGGSLARGLLAMVAGAAVPFLSYIVSQVSNGFPDFAGVSGYVRDQISIANIRNAPLVVAAYLFTGPAVIAEYILKVRPLAGTIGGAAVTLLALVSLGAFFVERQRVHRPVVLAFLVALPVFAAFIGCMRPTTPVQFAWVLGPVVAGLVALGLRTLCHTRGLRAAVAAVVLGSVLLNLWTLRALAMTSRSGEGSLPSSILDIKESPTRQVRDVWFPALAHSELGRALCAALPAAVHGHLAYVIDKDLGLDTLLACHDRSSLRLVGVDGPDHILGMTRPFWKALAREPDQWIGSLGITVRVRALLPRNGIAVATGETYLPRRPTRPHAIPAILEVTAAGTDALLVTNILGAYETFRVVSVHANGLPVAPLADNDLSQLYAATGADPIKWRFEFSATNPDAIDIVAIPDRGPR